MKSEREDPDVDPQQTIPPRQTEASRRISQRGEDGTAGTRGRRLKLGTPTRSAPSSPAPQVTPEVSATVQRGFTLGVEPEGNILSVVKSQTGVQPWILYLAAGAAVLLVVAIFLSSSSGASAEAIANDRLLSQYTKYLEANRQNSNLDINQRKKEVISRLQAVAWAKAIGDKAALQSELSGLLFLDNDKNSPLYQYSVNQLKRID